MTHSIRCFVARRISWLALAPAVACCGAAGAAEITVSALVPAQAVQDLGRIDAVAGYDAHVWRELARRARHPDLGSESPRHWAGKVDVDFVVAPDGSVSEAAVTRSSNAYALDGNAIRTVQRMRFKPVPAGAYGDGDPRRYLVTFDYRD